MEETIISPNHCLKDLIPEYTKYFKECKPLAEDWGDDEKKYYRRIRILLEPLNLTENTYEAVLYAVQAAYETTIELTDLGIQKLISIMAEASSEASGLNQIESFFKTCRNVFWELY